MIFQMKQQQSSNPVKPPFLMCTQLLQKSTLSNKSPSLSIKSSSLTQSKNHFKDYYKIKCQLQVKGKTIIQNIQKVEARDKQQSSSKQIIKQSKKQRTWFEQVPHKIKNRKQNQKMINPLQTGNRFQLSNFYKSSILMSPKQHRRYYKILKKNDTNQKSKTQYYSEQFISQEQLYKQKQFSSSRRKNPFYRTSKIQNKDLNQSREISIQLFEPRLKHKTRPSSGDPLRKYKMDSLIIKIKKHSITSITGGETSINILRNHISPLDFHEQYNQQIIKDNQPAVKKQQNGNALKNLKKKIILKTEPFFSKSKRRQIQIRSSGQGINPWSDDEGKTKNIIDEQINIRL